MYALDNRILNDFKNESSELFVTMAQDISEFVFEIYDNNGDMIIDKKEIVAIIEHSCYIMGIQMLNEKEIKEIFIDADLQTVTSIIQFLLNLFEYSINKYKTTFPR